MKFLEFQAHEMKNKFFLKKDTFFLDLDLGI